MARLATACVSVQKRLRTNLLQPETSSDPCWYCLLQQRNKHWSQMLDEKNTNQEFPKTDEDDTTKGVEQNLNEDDVVDLDDEDFTRPRIIIC